MAWYWNALIAFGVFNLVFVLLAWLIAAIREKTGADIPAGGAEMYVRQEYLLNFLQTMHLAENKKLKPLTFHIFQETSNEGT